MASAFFIDAKALAKLEVEFLRIADACDAHPFPLEVLQVRSKAKATPAGVAINNVKRALVALCKGEWEITGLPSGTGKPRDLVLQFRAAARDAGQLLDPGATSPVDSWLDRIADELGDGLRQGEPLSYSTKNGVRFNVVQYQIEYPARRSAELCRQLAFSPQPLVPLELSPGLGGVIAALEALAAKFPQAMHLIARSWDKADWPYVFCSDDGFRYLGVQQWEWSKLFCDVTGRRPADPATVIDTQWLEIGGELWQGCLYYGSAAAWGKIIAVSGGYVTVPHVVSEFSRVANLALGYLGIQLHPEGSLNYDVPLEPQAYHRLLEWVYQNAQPPRPDNYEFEIARLPGNVFAACAQALRNRASAANLAAATLPAQAKTVPTDDENPPGETATENSLVAVASLYTKGLAQAGLGQIAEIVGHTNLSADKKLKAMHKVLPIPPDVSAKKLGETLGVSSAAIQRTDWWSQNRKGKGDELTDRRHSVHQARKGLTEDRADEDR